jgi:hypothetical protein
MAGPRCRRRDMRCSAVLAKQFPEVGILTWMAEIRVECHAGYREGETPRRFYLGGRTIEIAQVISQWKEPGALFFRVRGFDGRAYVLRRDE